VRDKVKLILEVAAADAEKFLNQDCDILGIKFSNIEEAKILKRLLPVINKPIMVRGSGDDDIDKSLLPKIISILDRECIVGIVNENNYREIVPYAVDGGHTVIIRTPIDINLAKEMNILTGDMGLEKILIDPDIGGIGYGFEYGYSIMEKIKLEKTKDRFLDKPVISFASEETLKTKEAKDINMSKYLEIAAVSGVIAAGADYVVINNPEIIKTIRKIA